MDFFSPCPAPPSCTTATKSAWPTGSSPVKRAATPAPVPRTPMQWSRGKNLGFSTGTPESLYLPVDPDPNAPTVEGQEEDPQSLLHYTRALIALRHSHPELQARSPFSVYSAEPGSRLFAYKRGRPPVRPKSWRGSPCPTPGRCLPHSLLSGNGRNPKPSFGNPRLLPF